MGIIRWGMIGCGAVAEIKSGPAFRKARNSRLVAVMCRSAEKARNYARRHNVPRWYTDADALIRDPEVDAVYVATPPDTHMEYTLKIAAVGKPVYVEKPMARSYEECRTMIRACKAAGVPLFVAYYRRALPRFLKVKELLKSGAIGDVRFVSVRLYQPPYANDRNPEALPWRVVPKISGGGYFVDLASHTLDLLDFYLNPIVEVSGIAANQAGLYHAEDVVSACWRHKSDVMGNGIWCFTTEGKEDRVEIVGSRGKLSFATFLDHSVRLDSQGKCEEWIITNPLHIQQPLIQTVVDALNGEGACPSTGESAARTNRVMDQILKKYRKRIGLSFPGK